MQFPCAQYSPDQIADMHRRFLAGDKSTGWELVLSKLPLIKKVCSKRMGYCGAELDDLVQEYMITVYQALDKFKPDELKFDIFICRTIEDGPDRILRKCRLMAGLPLSTQACKKFKRDYDTDIGESYRDSSYGAIDSMVGEINDVLPLTRISEMGIAALDLAGHGLSRAEIREAINERFPDSPVTIPSLRKLIDDTIRQLQEALGTEGTARSLTHHEIDAETTLKILRLVLTQDVSPQKASTELLKSGVRVSYGYTYRLYLDHAIYDRRERIRNGEPLEKHLDEIFQAIREKKQAKLQSKKVIPPFADISDELWQQLEGLIPPAGKKANRRLNTAVVIYRALNGNIQFRELPPTGIHWDVAWRWEKKLKQAGVYSKVIELALA